MTIWQFVPQDIVTVVALVFGVIGFTRGARREVTLTLFIILAFALIAWFENGLVAWVNRLYFLLRFVLAGGLATDDISGVVSRLRDLPPLVADSDDRFILRLVVFFGLIWLGYYAGRRVKRVLTPVGVATLRRPPDLLARLAGAVAGAVNGFLIVYFLFPRIVQGNQAVLVVPTFSTSLLQQQWLFAVILAALAVIIFVGWERARG